MTRTTSHIRTAIAVVLALGAITAPTATAMLPPPDRVTATPSSATSSSLQPPAATTIKVMRVGAAGGFNWGDAAIGGGAAIALSVIVLGAAMAAGPRRGRRPSVRTTS